MKKTILTMAMALMATVVAQAAQDDAAEGVTVTE